MDLTRKTRRSGTGVVLAILLATAALAAVLALGLLAPEEAQAATASEKLSVTRAEKSALKQMLSTCR